MILWHVRFDITNQSREFSPRPPFNPMRGEDKEFHRICVATSIEGAISASPSGSKRLATALEIQDGLFYAFRIDTRKLHLKNIVSTKELSNYHGVDDAELTGECWLLDPFVVPLEDVFVYKVNSWRVHKQPSPSKEAIISLVQDLDIALVKDRQSYIDFLANDLRYLHSYGRLSMLYNDRFQINELIQGFQDGIDLLPYVNPMFDYRQIEQIRLGFKAGVNASLYADYHINFQNMLALRRALEKGLDIRNYLDPELSYLEIMNYVKGSANTTSMSLFGK